MAITATSVWINNTLLPPTADSGMSIVPHKIWSQNAGRTTATGKAVGDIKAIKYEISLSWAELSDTEFAIIDGLINNTTAFFNVKFCPKRSTGYITRKFYAGDPSYEIRQERDGKTFYGGVSVSLIEQ